MDNSQDNKLTINRVAELCGVSKTTISRYINGKYDNMSAETKERISKVIAGLDYRPNRTAQRLKAQRSMLIGCVIADAGNPFSAILLKGISGCCEAAGYQVLFADSSENPVKERRAIQDFLENRVDGLLINTTGDNNDYLAELKEKIPMVLVDRLSDIGDFDSVSSPDYETAFKITRMLIEMGYEDITVMSEPCRNITPRINRYRGYSDAAEQAGITPSLYEITDDNVSGCVEYLKQFVAANAGRRVAMLCTNGVAALNSMLAAAVLGLKIGYEFGCCTFDDWNWLQLSNPKITAIQLGTEEKGYEAAKLLLRRIEKNDEPDTEQIIVDSTIIVRSSTVSRPLDGKV